MNDEVTRLKEKIELFMAGPLPGEDAVESTTLFEAMRYTLEAPGKRVRPLLLLLACKAVGGNEDDAMPYACAIEFIHNYSLIHDDLPAMDNDDYRRGKLTNHKVFGEAMAILAGDGLLSAAFELMHIDYISRLNDPEALMTRVRAGAAIAEGAGIRGMVAGQSCDIEAEGTVISKELLDFIHLNKTAALIRAAVKAGACIGGGGDEAVNAITEYGEKIGLAFQIADDILDYGTEEGKASYPAIIGLGLSCSRLAELTEQAVLALENAEGIEAKYKDILVEMARSFARRAA